MSDSQSEHVWMRLHDLLVRGADPHPSLIAEAERYRGLMGQTFLHWLCLGADVACIKRFVAAGIDLNGQDDVGNTALMEAAAACRWDVVKVLVAAGASTQVVNYDGEDLEDYLELYGLELPEDILVK